MNIKPLKSDELRDEYVKVDYRKLKKGDIVSCYYYSVEIRSYYNSNTKELLENNKLVKNAKRIKIEKRNQRIVSDYLRQESKKLSTRKK